MNAIQFTALKMNAITFAPGLYVIPFFLFSLVWCLGEKKYVMYNK